MKNKNIKFYLIGFVVLIILSCIFIKLTAKKSSKDIIKEISPTMGYIQTSTSSTGSVLPKNRLELKPPVNGRIEKILVKEGENVKTGQTIAWMSSTERAALLDAARGQGEEKLKYWQDVYKPIALLAPIDGEVIVAKTQPGQTVTTADAVIVLSDKLILRAQVDETDIGKISLDQKAEISLDAYPETKIKAKVEHLYYESKTVNNVTTYEVDLVPEEVPAFFRSGMNATINFIHESKDNVLVIPIEAVNKDNNDENFVFIKKENVEEPVKQNVVLGVSDDKNVEVISGLDVNDKIILKKKKYSLPKNNSGKNPFMPNKKKEK